MINYRAMYMREQQENDMTERSNSQPAVDPPGVQRVHRQLYQGTQKMDKLIKCPELDTEKFNKYLETLSEWDEINHMGPRQKYYHLKEVLRKHKDGGLYADRLDMSLKDSRDQDDIIKLCIGELKKYFGKPAMQQHAEQLSKFWNIKRTSDETIKEFVQRFCNEKAKLEEYGFKKSDKEVTIILKTAICLEPYKWQSIITKCDYDSPHLFKEILREIGNLTEINEKVVLSESPAFLMYSARCGCQQCKEHDRLYNQSRGIPPTPGAMEHCRSLIN